MDNKKYDELRLSNRSSLIAYSLMNFILVVCYFIEVLKKSRTIGYFIVFCIFALVPYAICAVVYAKNKGTPYFKYAFAGGFVLFYLFILFTTVSPVAFVYAFLIAVTLISYNDIKVSGAFMGTVLLGNVIQVVYFAVVGRLDASDMANTEIRVASVLLFMIYLVMATNISKKNNEGRIAQIELEKERTAGMMKEILNVADQITDAISQVSGRVEILENTANKTKDSMSEVAAGTNDAVESIQIQLEKTEQIQTTINNVRKASGTIYDNVSDAKTELDSSRRNMDELIRCVQVSNDASENVSTELVQLREQTGRMQSIIDLINNITSQTSLLALNASIEAARAGEAGRGFAVVASEISNLADQTQTATEDITQVINSISSELENVVKVVEKMINISGSQNQAAGDTAKSFTRISEKTDRVFSEVSVMNGLVHELNDANQVIVEGIQTISGITEEVTAHSTETLKMSEDNSAITQEVGRTILGLKGLAEDLKQLEG